MEYKNLPISDSHIHIFWDMSLEERLELLKKIMKKHNYDTATILTIPLNSARKVKSRDYLENLKAFYVKSKMPEKIYTFAGFSHYYDDSKNTPEFYLNQAKFYMESGFDGLKMIEGRVNQRFILGHGYNDERYDLMYDYAEKNRIPIVIHTSGPEFLWEKGGMFEKHEFGFFDYYDELDRMMSKFPKLKVTFAHFNFITGHVDMAAEFLDKWENVYYDLTPNQFMFLDFQKKPDEWKDFFIKYQDRIIYGTDIGANTKDLDGTEADSLVHMVRGFFEETNPYSELGYDFIPIPLGDSILKKFYKKNMMKFYEGKSPKVPVSSVMEEELKEVMKMRILLNVDEAADLELIKTVF